MRSCIEELPRVDHFRFADPPEEKGLEMEFRLIYRGPLPAQGSGDSRAPEKQAIRKALHPQLKELWNQNQERFGDPAFAAKNFDQFGFHFCPVVTKRHVLGCAIDILFLRRDAPGNLVRSGGDIDNRIKVLLDGLRMPQERNELAGAIPSDDEVPFFCLLQDDSLITEIHVTTDRLLVPVMQAERVNDVVLILRVVVNYIVPTMDEFIFTQQYALKAYLRTLEDAFGNITLKDLMKKV